MQVPHRSFVVVADGKKMLFFRNEGDSEYPKLEIERKRETSDAPDRDRKTDLAGRAPSASGGAGYSSYEEVDFHQLEEDRFAADTAEMLRKRALSNDFESMSSWRAQTLGSSQKKSQGSESASGEGRKDRTAIQSEMRNPQCLAGQASAGAARQP